MIPESVKEVGSLAGLISLIFLLIKGGINFIRQPKLKLVSKNVGPYLITDKGWNRQCATLYVENKGKRTARDSLPILEIVKKSQQFNHFKEQYKLHWADVPYSNRTDEAEPIDIRSGEQRRLDVVFTQEDQEDKGCWISTAYALNQEQPSKNQFYLPPGVYKVKVTVNCESGGGDEGEYKITSPKDWNELKIDGKPSPQILNIQPQSTAAS